MKTAKELLDDYFTETLNGKLIINPDKPISTIRLIQLIASLEERIDVQDKRDLFLSEQIVSLKERLDKLEGKDKEEFDGEVK